ncbi:MAG TPA: GAF domain-containing protein [Actinospica sp.]|nr:GAF domain-containing protein [Actinospica sp.]
MTGELDETVLANARPDVAAWFDGFRARHGAVAGCVHLARHDGLVLVAASNIPAAIQNTVAFVTLGKGVAGVTAERGEPVVLRDVQTDESGVVRPRAKTVGTRGSVSVPVLGADGAVLAVVGVGFADERLFDDAEVAAYQADAAGLLHAIEL